MQDCARMCAAVPLSPACSRFCCPASIAVLLFILLCRCCFAIVATAWMASPCMCAHGLCPLRVCLIFFCSPSETVEAWPTTTAAGFLNTLPPDYFSRTTIQIFCWPTQAATSCARPNSIAFLLCLPFIRITGMCVCTKKCLTMIHSEKRRVFYVYASSILFIHSTRHRHRVEVMRNVR